MIFLLILSIVFALTLAILVFKTRYFKCFFGKQDIVLAIKDVLKDDSKYQIFRNVQIGQDSKRVDAWLVLVSRRGLYVIEAKYLPGELFGREKCGLWISETKNDFPVQNPLKIPDNAASALSLSLMLKRDVVKGVVVNFARCRWDWTRAEKPDNFCIGVSEFKTFLEKQKAVFDDGEFDAICQYMASGTIVSSDLNGLN